MRDETFDIVYLIALAAMIISLGYVTILNEYKDTRYYSSEFMEDKNVGKIESLVIPVYGDYDGTLTKGDVIIMSQIQDYYMPAPKVIQVEDGGKLTITSTVEGNIEAYGHQMAQYVNASGGERFSIVYNNGTDLTTADDDYYFIKKMR